MPFLFRFLDLLVKVKSKGFRNSLNVKWKSLSPLRCFVTPWTITCQAPLSMGFSSQEYWSRLPCLLQGIFPTQGPNLSLLHWRQILYCLSHRENEGCGTSLSGYIQMLIRVRSQVFFIIQIRSQSRRVCCAVSSFPDPGPDSYNPKE